MYYILNETHIKNIISNYLQTKVKNIILSNNKTGWNYETYKLDDDWNYSYIIFIYFKIYEYNLYIFFLNHIKNKLILLYDTFLLFKPLDVYYINYNNKIYTDCDIFKSKNIIYNNYKYKYDFYNLYPYNNLQLCIFKDNKYILYKDLKLNNYTIYFHIYYINNYIYYKFTYYVRHIVINRSLFINNPIYILFKIKL